MDPRKGKNWIFVTCLLFLHLFTFIVLQQNQQQPAIPIRYAAGIKSAQLFPTSILCNASNGKSYQQGQIETIAWNITGYEAHLYTLEDNGIALEFGTVASNNSFIIYQKVGQVEGWHAFSVHVYASGIMLDESYVVLNIIAPVNFWETNLSWVVASVAVVSATSLNVFFYKRKVKSIARHPELELTSPKPKDQMKDTFKIESISSYLAQADLLFSSNPIEENDWDYISTTRVEKSWLCTIPFAGFLVSNVFRPDLVDSTRNNLLDKELTSYFTGLSKLSFQETREGLFLNITGLQDFERLLVVTDGSNLAIILLLNGRITRKFLIDVGKTLAEICSSLKIKNQNISDIPHILEKNLQSQRSTPYIEPSSQTTQVLSGTGFLREDEEQDIWNDARGLTPNECNQIVHRIKQARDAPSGDPILDEAEDLSGEINNH